MNYIKPEDVKAYVEQHPKGIAGRSEELAVMINHFVKTAVYDCVDICKDTRYDGTVAANRIKFVFGINE